MVSLLLAVLTAAPASPCSGELFRIGRNKNANVVLYEARSRDGHLDPREPVTVSWLMLATQGQRESLNFLERAFAYGFEVRPAAPAPGYTLTLKALKGRGVKVVERDACPAALAAIGGREGVLQRIYVHADESAMVPAVQYVELFGVDALTGDALYEKLLPGAER